MVEVKRGYAKWTDEDGVKHKVPLDEYNAMLELKGEQPLGAETEEEEEDTLPGTDETVVERDAEVADRAFNSYK